MNRRFRQLVALLASFTALAAACSSGSVFESVPTDGSASAPSVTTATTSDTGSGGRFDPALGPDPDPSPLPVDPAVRIGQLDNGLTYYLRTNRTPGGSISLRLVVNAGAAQQQTSDGGTAHFLEHMLFNGTEKFPGNDLTIALAELGIQFGADTNAYTSYDETVYQLSASTSNRDAVSTAFDVLAEWAAAATLEPADVADEVGVVRDEMRQDRESADGMIFSQFESMYTDRSSYEGFTVIGSPGPVEATTAPPLRTFYDRWYRPDNMAVIVVGDMPLNDMEAAVTARFAKIEPRGTDLPERNEFQIDISANPTGRVITNPGNVADNISVDLQLQPWDQGTIGGERLAIIEALMTSMLDNRLANGFQDGTLHTATSPTMDPFAISRGLRYVGTNLQADDLELALVELISLWKGAAESGFTDAEFTRAEAELRSFVEEAIQRDGTRQDAEFTAAYVSHFLEGSDIDTTRSMVDRISATLDSLSASDVADYWRWVMQTSGPIIAAVGADPATLPTPERLVEIASRTAAAEGSGTVDKPQIETLMERPDPSPLTDTTTARTGNGSVIEWDLPNGARVVFQQTRIEEGTVAITTASEGGWSLLPSGSRALTGVVADAVGGSGLGEFSRSQLDDFLSSATASLFSYIDSTTEGFFGGSSTDDLEVLFQLLNLSITSAKVDDPAFRQARTFADNFLTASNLDPRIKADIAMNRARTAGLPDWALVPTQDQLAALTAGQLLTLYQSRLAKVDQTIIVVVGDADPDVVKDLARRYVGSIDAGPHDTWVDLLPSMPLGVTTTEVTLDPGVNTGGVDILYSTPADVTPRLEVTARVVETILSARILDTIREQLGASYGGNASLQVFYAPDERIEASISIDGDPARVTEIRDATLEQIADLAANGPTSAEFERAINVLASDYQFVSNQLFVETIIASRLFPDEEILDADNRVGLLDRVRPTDVRDLARFALPADRRIEVLRTEP